jgi:hypothetical protein
MNKVFSELAVGDRFTLNGQEFIKINDVRVSCCKTVNACSANDSNNTIYVQPSSEVGINA